MYKRLVVLAAVTFGFTAEAMADGLNYSYLQAELIGSEVRAGGDSTSGEGFGVSASAGLGSTWTGFLSIERTKYSETGASLKFTPISLGVGFHAALSPMVDFVGGASFERMKVGAALSGFGSGTTTESGWGLGAGLRGLVGEQLQWEGGIRYRDVGDLESILGFAIGGRYYFTPAFGLGLEFSSEKYDEDVLDFKENKVSLGFRYEFAGGA